MVEDERMRRSLWLEQVYTRGGWMRYLPPAAVNVVSALLHEPQTVEQIDMKLRASKFTAAGWQSEAWEPLHPWTDEELAAQRADPDFGDETDDADAATANAEEAAERAARIAEIDGYSQHLGVAQVRTLADVLELMVACRVLTRTGDAGGAVVDFAFDAPLPAKVLPLSAEEREKEDRLRWRSAYEPVAGSIIGLFDPDAQDRPAQLRTSLQRLARQLDVDAQTARAAALLLLDDGDFTANRDLERIAEHQVFELAADWERFDRERMSVRLAMPEAAEE